MQISTLFMINERDQVLINHILDAATSISAFIVELSLEDFIESDLVLSAVVKKFEIIGEAANKLSQEAQQLHPGIPWSDIIGMRNILIHDYTGIDAESVWNTIQVYLPQLVDTLLPYKFSAEQYTK